MNNDLKEELLSMAICNINSDFPEVKEEMKTIINQIFIDNKISFDEILKLDENSQNYSILISFLKNAKVLSSFKYILEGNTFLVAQKYTGCLVGFSHFGKKLFFVQKIDAKNYADAYTRHYKVETEIFQPVKVQR